MKQDQLEEKSPRTIKELSLILHLMNWVQENYINLTPSEEWEKKDEFVVKHEDLMRELVRLTKEV